MNSTIDNLTSPTDTRVVGDRNQSPPAFLDLADSAARLGTNMPDISARVELKRKEHERQRAIQRTIFEEQMRALEQQQQQELLSLPVGGSALQQFAASAPTTPPHVNAALAGGERSPHSIMRGHTFDAHILPAPATAGVDKRKSVTYAPSTEGLSPLDAVGNGSIFSRAGAKSMPASRRTSASEHDEELAAQLQGLSVHEASSPIIRTSPQTGINGLAYGLNGGMRPAANGKGYNAGMLLDEQIEQEMQNTMRQMSIADASVYQGSSSGSTALYNHGSRFGLNAMGGGRTGGPDKMNGLHGPKHKRGDIDLNRFAGTRLEELQGDIANLCRDQHGCRFLQKKLEEGVQEHRDMIFRETFGHFAELMTDPFGNYLCQKLLEFSTDEQRNVICESVAQDLVNISLNMHGTRAVQKMIDFLSTQRQADLRYNAQIHSIIVALSLHVVVLIKDLNGNHVIQKCLNKLAPEDNQFIYNAVAANCVEVATHRHGCCVLQRCIDHASDHQRVQLVNEITYNALTLVQDPYGNYVVQYILDLNDNRFSDAVIRQFTGNVCALSVQKFSSNVIEKCIRVAEHNTRKMLIEELLNRTRLEKLLRDSFGNYCVQTALDYAEPGQRALLVEGIRPILPLIRNTPYGKRIQSKLQREQMDMSSSNITHYGNGAYNQAYVGIGVNGRGPMGVGIHPAGQMNDLYSSRSSMYGLGQNGSGSLGQQQMLQQPLHSLGGQTVDGYVIQGGNGHALSTPANGFSNVNGLGAMQVPAGAFGASVGIAGGLNDPYSRTTYGYTM